MVIKKEISVNETQYELSIKGREIHMEDRICQVAVDIGESEQIQTIYINVPIEVDDNESLTAIIDRQETVEKSITSDGYNPHIKNPQIESRSLHSALVIFLHETHVVDDVKVF